MKILLPLGAEWAIHKKYLPKWDISIYNTSWVVAMHKVPVRTPKLCIILAPDWQIIFTGTRSSKCNYRKHNALRASAGTRVEILQKKSALLYRMQGLTL